MKSTFFLEKNNIFPIVILIFLFIPELFFDSVIFADYNDHGKLITSICVIATSIYLFLKGALRLKVLMMIMVPLSWFGEVIFSEWLNLYEYRNDQIPIYVPFGHAIVYALAWALSQKSSIKKKTQDITIFILVFFIAAFSFAIFYLKDTLSILFGILFVLILLRKKLSLFYLIMSMIVLYVELVGTYFGVWKWEQSIGILNTVNPPVGAIAIYVGGDVLLSKVTRLLIKLKRKLSHNR